jgi:hypothetical protein
LRAGNLVDARRYHRECILGWQKFGARVYIAQELERFALIAQSQNQPARAARLLGAGEALREGIRVPAFGDERHDIDSAVAWLHTQFDDTAYRTHWADGRAMGMDQVIAYALE